MDIAGTVAIVTGASSGIGEATARLFAQKGVKVALASRSTDKLNKLAKELPGSFVITTDITKPAQIKKLVAEVYRHFGRIDILINNSGRGYDCPTEKIELDKFHELFDLDLAGPLIAMQHVIPIMKKQGKGSIVNISSGTALMAIPNLGAYSSLKRALVGLSLTAREELVGDHVAVSVVYPYITKTNFDKNMMTTKGARLTWDDTGDRKLPEFDSASHVAQKILVAVETGKAEIFAHDWMKKI